MKYKMVEGVKKKLRKIKICIHMFRYPFKRSKYKENTERMDRKIKTWLKKFLRLVER